MEDRSGKIITPLDAPWQGLFNDINHDLIWQTSKNDVLKLGAGSGGSWERPEMKNQ